ncbi:MAG: hypothetical protein IPJ13_04060 [Saprospiraceae bacterium]|nr:hypothetical protein [Saprospiraceae bacterium]
MVERVAFSKLVAERRNGADATSRELLLLTSMAKGRRKELKPLETTTSGYPLYSTE